MGGGVSLPFQHTKSEKNSDNNVAAENKRLDMIQSVEHFLSVVAKNTDYTESVWLILTSFLGEKHFRSFLAAENLEEVLSFFQEIASVKAANGKSFYGENMFQTKVRKVCHHYYNGSGPVTKLLQGTLCVEMNLLNNGISEEICGTIVNKILSDLAYLFAQHTFIPFLESNHYSKWRAIERSHAVATKLQDSQKLKRLNSEYTYRDSLALIIQRKVKAVCSPTDLAFTAVAGIHESCATEILEYHCDWLLSLLSASEVLPISFFVCTSNLSDKYSSITRSSSDSSKKRSNNNVQEELDFPILFVNKYFQTLNQRKASSVLGDSVVDVFSGDGENSVDTFKRLFTVQKKLHSHNIEEITLVKKDQQFKNFLAVKPIFNNFGDLCYYIGLQLEEGKGYDLTQCPKDLLSSWMGLLPELIVIDEE